LSAGDLRVRLATLERAIASAGRTGLEAPEVSVLVQAVEPSREQPVDPIARSGASAPPPVASPALIAGVRTSPPERTWQPSPPRRLVQVSIGRLEIRVDREPQAARRVPAEAVTATSLSEYLDRRNGAGR
jgi:hypothetical protein